MTESGQPWRQYEKGRGEAKSGSINVKIPQIPLSSPFRHELTLRSGGQPEGGVGEGVHVRGVPREAPQRHRTPQVNSSTTTMTLATTMSNTMMLMHRQERRASRDSEKGREGEVSREGEDRKGVKKEDGEEEEGGHDGRTDGRK